jgi:radical SAM superfamily enzyme YgiQ (UPF0313 family)
VPDAKFALMGDHVTALPEESMTKCPSLDYVITGGDYDLSLLKLAEHMRDGAAMPKGIWHKENGHIEDTGGFELMENLDVLPFIDRDLAEWTLYKEFNFKNSPYTYIMAGRDCPWHKCTFCSWTTLYPKFRARSPENVLNEIGMLIDKYGVREIFDDSGTFPPGEWLRKFCQGMIERGFNEKIYLSCNFRFDYLKPDLAKLMKKAGFRLIKSGLESGNQKTLERINKGITVDTIRNGCSIAKEAGLDVHLTMIVGYPWESKEDAMNTLKLAKELMLSNMAEVLQATVVVPYPGTPLYDQAIKNKWFAINPQDYERYDMREPVLISGMSPEDTMKICSSIYREIFLSPRFIANRLLKLRSLEDFKYAFNGVKAVLGHITDFAGN